jgi:hypothetical protein
MAQAFSPRADTVLRVLLVLLPLALVVLGVMLYVNARSGSTWNVGAPAPQPIPFRHDLHAGTLGVDCAYCHSTAARASFAGMPSAQTCMTCHAQVWVGASVLQPLRTSLALNQPIVWTSVHRLADYVYFNHAAHVSKGVACATCHGDVATMPEIVKANTLSMGWCLDCHRQPERYLNPQQAAAAIGLTRTEKPAIPGAPADANHAGLPKLYWDGEVQGLYDAVRRYLTSCDTCHH